MDLAPKTHAFFHLRSCIERNSLLGTLNMSYNVWASNLGCLDRAAIELYRGYNSQSRYYSNMAI